MMALRRILPFGLRRSLFSAALACACALAGAHSFHAGMTDISYNERTGSTEVVHTYMAHDVEALLANLYGRPFDLSDPDDQAALRKYLDQHFWLTDKDGQRLALGWIGLQADADNVVVFQEAPRTTAARIAAIHDAMLGDFVPDQVNTVNLTVAGSLRSFGFTSSRSELPVR